MNASKEFAQHFTHRQHGSKTTASLLWCDLCGFTVDHSSIHTGWFLQKLSKFLSGFDRTIALQELMIFCVI